MPLIVHLALGKSDAVIWFLCLLKGITMPSVPCYLTTVLCEFADTHKAPWKWRGLHKSLVLFTQQMFSPENKVINGTIVQLVERVQKFPFTTSRSSCGWLYGLSVLMPSCIQNSLHNGLSWNEKLYCKRWPDYGIASHRTVLCSQWLHMHLVFLAPLPAERSNSRNSGHMAATESQFSFSTTLKTSQS